MHIVTLTFVADLAEVDAAVADHMAWIDLNYADGVFLASGGQVPRVGGVIIADGITRAELDERLSRDPFKMRGLAEYSVVTFTPSRPEVLAAFLSPLSPPSPQPAAARA